MFVTTILAEAPRLFRSSMQRKARSHHACCEFGQILDPAERGHAVGRRPSAMGRHRRISRALCERRNFAGVLVFTMNQRLLMAKPA